MNIAVTTSGDTLESPVFEKFDRTPYLLIIDVETMDYVTIEHPSSPDSERKLAQAVVSHRCEAVITGLLTEVAFDIIADDGITRFAAKNMTARQALDAMEKRSLDIIRNPQGTNQCSGTHHH